MVQLRWLKPGMIIGVLLLAVLGLAAACGGDDVEVTREVVKEVPVTVVVTKVVQEEVEVTREVVMEKVLVQTPTPISMAMEQTTPDWVQLGKAGGGILTFLSSSNPGDWDMHRVGSFATILPSSPRFNQLIEYNPMDFSQIQGDLAKGWTLSDDGKTYTFGLHDAQWHDGTDVTAADIAFSVNRILERGKPRGRVAFLHAFAQSGAARVIDEKTVSVTLDFAAGAFISNLAQDYMKMYQQKNVASFSQEDLSCCPKNWVGSGPFIITDFAPQEFYAYERNPNYFKEGRPYLDGAKVFLIQGLARQVTAYETEQVIGDWSPTGGGTPPLEMRALEDRSEGRLRAINMPGAVMWWILVNPDKPPFDDPNVRKALNLAVDRQLAIDLAFDGVASLGTYFPPAALRGLGITDADIEKIPGFRKDKVADLKEANRLLAEAGFADGLKVSFAGGNTTGTIKAQEQLAAQLRADVNIDMTIMSMPVADAHSGMASGLFQVEQAVTGMVIFDPGDILGQTFLQGSGRNPQDYSDPEIDALIDKQAREPDPDKRNVILRELFNYLSSEGTTSHAIPYVWSFSSGALDHRIRNYVIPPTQHLSHKWDQAWWDPDAPKHDYKGHTVDGPPHESLTGPLP